jgi:hypothetical protein
MVKYGIKILIGSEEFFKLVAPHLPFEITGVEEMVDLPAPKPPPAVATPHQQIRAKYAARQASLEQPKQPKQRKSGFNPNRGMNAVIIAALRKGPHTTNELRKVLVAAGYKDASLTSQMEKLARFRRAVRTGKGIWESTDVPNTEEAHGITDGIDRIDSADVGNIEVD